MEGGHAGQELSSRKSLESTWVVQETAGLGKITQVENKPLGPMRPFSSLMSGWKQGRLRHGKAEHQ